MIALWAVEQDATGKPRRSPSPMAGDRLRPRRASSLELRRGSRGRSVQRAGGGVGRRSGTAPGRLRDAGRGRNLARSRLSGMRRGTVADRRADRGARDRRACARRSATPPSSARCSAARRSSTRRCKARMAKVLEEVRAGKFAGSSPEEEQGYPALDARVRCAGSARSRRPGRGSKANLAASAGRTISRFRRGPASPRSGGRDCTGPSAG